MGKYLYKKKKGHLYQQLYVLERNNKWKIQLLP